MDGTATDGQAFRRIRDRRAIVCVVLTRVL